MKIWKKKSFYHHNWFWCQLHGIDIYHLHLITGSFMRRTANCEIKEKFDGGLYARIY